jgi:hypothetical protein
MVFVTAKIDTASADFQVVRHIFFWPPRQRKKLFFVLFKRGGA